MHISINIDGNTTKEQLHGLSKAATALAEGAMSREEFLTVQRGMMFPNGQLAAYPAPDMAYAQKVAMSGGGVGSGAPVGAAAETAEEATTGERKTRSRAKKGDTAAPAVEEATSSAPVAEASAAPAPQPEAAPAEELTAQSVRDQLKVYVEKHGMEAATAKLAEMGFQMVSQIPADKFASAIEALAV